MHEKEFVSGIETTRRFYETLTLPDIVGKKRDNPKVLSLTWEQYQEFSGDMDKAREYAASFGIDDIGSMGNNRPSLKESGPYLEENISTPHMSWWVPHHTERNTILALATSVSEGKRPQILEVGYGTGFVAKLLALDNSVDITGIDNNLKPGKYKTSTVPPLPNVTLLQDDVWNIINRFGPLYQQDTTERRSELLSALQAAGQTFAVDHFLGGMYLGETTGHADEINELQTLTQQYDEESPVDVVLCSFMNLNSELTIPIRDGIHPKIIVYAKSNNGRTGAGDYYDALEHEKILNVEKFNAMESEEEEELEIYDSPTPDTHISFNPGRNYTTIARWNTLWKQDYPNFGQPWVPQNPKAKPTGEVVIQMRNDIVIPSRKDVYVKKYNFDTEMENLLGDNLPHFLDQFKSV